MESTPIPEPVDANSHAANGADAAEDGGSGEVVEATGDQATAPEQPDGTGAGGNEENGPDPLRFSNWMKRSATGAVMSGIAVGLKEALQPKQPIPFVIEASGEPEDPDKPIDLKFDPDSPAATVAIIRRPPVVEDPQSPAPPA